MSSLMFGLFGVSWPFALDNSTATIVSPTTPPTTTQVPPRASFLGLPSELRLEIYDLLFVTQVHTFHVAKEVRCQRDTHSMPFNDPSHITVGILQACKQVRREALPKFQATRVMSFEFWSFKKSLDSWAGKIVADAAFTASLQCVRHVKITIHLGLKDNLTEYLETLDWLLAALDHGKSLRKLTIVFKLSQFPGSPAEEVSFIKAFRQVKFPSTVRTFFTNDRRHLYSPRPVFKTEYDELVKVLKA